MALGYEITSLTTTITIKINYAYRMLGMALIALCILNLVLRKQIFTTISIDG